MKLMIILSFLHVILAEPIFYQASRTLECTLPEVLTCSQLNPKDGDVSKDTRPCKCKVPDRIVGGAVAVPHSIPFQVGLATSPSGTSPFCGGSLISASHVLTAAHCTVGRSAASIRVIVGDHNFQITGDGEQFFAVQSILVHPSYAAATSEAFDFSILRLTTAVTLPSPTAGIVCLPQDVSQTFAGSSLTISGWGTTSSGGVLSPALKVAAVTGVTNAACQTSYPLETIGSYHLCAALANTDTCQGDSGGPITAVVNSRTTLVGLTSWGYGCADPRYPGVYARVSNQKAWILANSAATDCSTPPNSFAPFHRYWNGKEHFYTTNANEIGTVTIGATGLGGYKYEGSAGSISTVSGTNLVPLYRYFNGEHFYTTAASEIGTITPGATGSGGYKFEGIAGYCYQSSASGLNPLHRYFNGKEHFYTTNAGEIGTTTVGATGSGGYRYEGVACYIKP